MISKGTGYYALRYSLSGLVIQLVCSGYTVCLGRKHNQAGAAIQSVWGVSTIRLGCLYSQAGAICTGRIGCGNLELLYSLIFSIQYIVQFSALSTSVQFAYTNYSAIFIIYVIHTLFRSIVKSFFEGFICVRIKFGSIHIKIIKLLIIVKQVFYRFSYQLDFSLIG